MSIDAPKLGAILGVTLTAAFFAWERTRPPACPGAVFVELRPPLLDPGVYHFRWILDDGTTCEHDQRLPPPKAPPRHACKLALALETRTTGARTSIVGLRLGAAPKKLRFEVKRDGEAIYAADLEPEYSPYEIRREDDKRFCGPRALLRPPCIRSSSQCLPFEPSCDGPEDCASDRVCCVDTDSGREFGAEAASQCRTRRACLDGFGAVACHRDADCPKTSRCGATPLSEFRPALLVCEEGPARAESPRQGD
ncbi:MAG TPA: hypothetical protein VKZ49_03600 [Polyangiaceae bacterium]|nr:hypothetical protein [Polyangiaceae bacterium]